MNSVFLFLFVRWFSGSKIIIKLINFEFFKNFTKSGKYAR